LLRVFGFIAASIVSAFIIIAIAFQYIDSPKEKILHRENDDLKENYAVLQQRIEQLQKQMLELETRDNAVYRSIFEATPIPDSARLKEMEKNKELQLVQRMDESELLKSLKSQLNTLSLRVTFQSNSYKE